MKRLVFAFIIIIFLAGSSYGQERKVELWFNGEVWTSPALSPKDYLAQSLKVYLIRGIYEGVYYSSPDKLCKKYTCDKNYDELVSDLDKFYGNKENIKIPVVDALEIIAMEDKEMDKDLIKEKLRIQRKTFEELVPE